MNRDPRQLTLAYLASHRVMTLATQGPLGLWAAAVFYVNEQWELYFLSAGHTRHAQNIAANPHVAATVQEDYADWQAIKGIQLEGEVRLLTGAERERAIGQYQLKYPFIANGSGRMQEALHKTNWYGLTPGRVYFIDNSLGLGHRDELPQPLSPS